MTRRFLTLAFLAFFLAPGCFPAEPVTFSLPSPKKAGSMSLEAALAARRSVRGYTKQTLTIAEVGQLLWAAQGVTSPDDKRTAPSAMHRYPLEIAVVAQNVGGLPSGAYRYVSATHSLEPFAPAKPGAPLLAGSAPQAQVQSAPAVFVIPPSMSGWDPERKTVLLPITKRVSPARTCCWKPSGSGLGPWSREASTPHPSRKPRS